MPAVTRPDKITFAEVRSAGVRGVLARLIRQRAPERLASVV